MSDFFGNLGGGFRFPNTQMNQGPLPSFGAGAPEGAGGDPDGRINFNSALLEGITPYNDAKSGRIGSDRNYQQIPHRIQKIVPQIWVPSASHFYNKVPVSHVVDQGDIAFSIISENMASLLYSYPTVGSSDKDRVSNHSAFLNISTVNYLLAGICREDQNHNEEKPTTWDILRNSLCISKKDMEANPTIDGDQFFSNLIQTRIIPFGICAGSEKQGGQNETGMAPVQAAANHITTMTVDGQNIDLVNYWANCDLSSGDQLIFRLEILPTQHYVLNHYYKGTVSQTFKTMKECPQLIPDVYRMSYKPADPDFDYRIHGYWRIAQVMQQRKRCRNFLQNVHVMQDNMNMTYGGSAQLLQVLFAPVFVKCDGSHDGLLLSSFGEATGTHSRPTAAGGGKRAPTTANTRPAETGNSSRTETQQGQKGGDTVHRDTLQGTTDKERRTTQATQIKSDDDPGEIVQDLSYEKDLHRQDNSTVNNTGGSDGKNTVVAVPGTIQSDPVEGAIGLPRSVDNENDNGDSSTTTDDIFPEQEQMGYTDHSSMAADPSAEEFANLRDRLYSELQKTFPPYGNMQIFITSVQTFEGQLGKICQYFDSELNNRKVRTTQYISELSTEINNLHNFIKKYPSVLILINDMPDNLTEFKWNDFYVQKATTDGNVVQKSEEKFLKMVALTDCLRKFIRKILSNLTSKHAQISSILLTNIAFKQQVWPWFTLQCINNFQKDDDFTNFINEVAQLFGKKFEPMTSKPDDSRTVNKSIENTKNNFELLILIGSTLNSYAKQISILDESKSSTEIEIPWDIMLKIYERSYLHIQSFIQKTTKSAYSDLFKSEFSLNLEKPVINLGEEQEPVSVPIVQPPAPKRSKVSIRKNVVNVT